MKKLLTVTVALAALATPAVAADWYVYNASKQLCIPSVDAGRIFAPTRSPAAFEQYLRNTQQFKERNIVRDDDGVITGVEVANQHKMSVSFFTTLDNCQTFRKWVIKQEGDNKELE